MKKMLVPAAIASVAFVFALGSGRAAMASNEIGLIYDGLAVPNSKSPPAIAAFDAWCDGDCIPTVELPVFDTSTGKERGYVYVWAKLPFLPGAIIASSFCFSEFIVFALKEGDIYAHSGPNGTCGATMDPLLKPPLHPELGALTVIAGGGDGIIVGGTGKYHTWVDGTFTDRVFVGFGAPESGVGGIVYYDQLIFSLFRP